MNVFNRLTVPETSVFNKEESEELTKGIQMLFLQIAFDKDLPGCMKRITYLIDCINALIGTCLVKKQETKPFEKMKNNLVILKTMVQIRMKKYLLN